jgi:hypothetical protein
MNTVECIATIFGSLEHGMLQGIDPTVRIFGRPMGSRPLCVLFSAMEKAVPFLVPTM